MIAGRLGAVTLAVVMVLSSSAASLGAGSDHTVGPRDGSTSFVGIDGLGYAASSPVVAGLLGEKFYGPDFDLACDYGADINKGMEALARLARLIEKSGRTVVFTVAPNKSSVVTARVDRARLPHGRCDREGLRQQQRQLDRFDDPHYLPLRQALREPDYETYWKTDLHWTSVGGSIFTKALATKLDPRLGELQKYVMGSYTGLGGLNALDHDPTQETVLTALSRNGVKVTPRRVSADDILDTTWRSAPPDGAWQDYTWPGRTLVVGDSMMSAAFYTMRPIFKRGRFMWLGHVDTADIAEAIADSDTVILETIQLFLPVVDLVTTEFRREVKRALRGT